MPAPTKDLVPASTLALPCQVVGPAVLPLRRSLLHAVREGGDRVVDRSAVVELSPAGQALLGATSRGARHRGGHLHLAGPSPAVHSALAATGLLHLRSSGPPSYGHAGPPVSGTRRSA